MSKKLKTSGQFWTFFKYYFPPKSFQQSEIDRPMLKLTREKIRKALDMLSSGVSLRETSQTVGIGKTTLSVYANKEGIPLSSNKGGRPQKLSPRVERALVRSMEGGEYKSAVEAAEDLSYENQENVSRQTIMRACHRNGLHCYVKPLKPRLLPHHIKKRLEWGRCMKESTVDDWQSVIFTDESKYNLQGPNNALKIWRYLGIQLRARHIRQVVKYGGGSVMVWGAITSRGV